MRLDTILLLVQAECSTALLVMVGITVMSSWVGLVVAVICLTWSSCKHCDCSRSSYFPVRVKQRRGYLRLNRSQQQQAVA